MENEFDNPKMVTEAMRVALARAYADGDLREYLIRTSQAAHQSALILLDAGKHEEAKRFANRSVAFKDLLEKAKSEFNRTQKVGKIKDEPNATEKREE